MKKVTMAATAALASLFVAGATASAADTTSATDSLSGLTSSLGGSSSTDSTSSLSGNLSGSQEASKDQTHFVDTDGKVIAPTVEGIVAAQNISGYTLVSSRVEAVGPMPAAGSSATDSLGGLSSSTSSLGGLSSSTSSLGGNSETANSLFYVYTGATTVNFTANFNDGTPAAKFTWNFPAGTNVTYAKLFEMAGLNPNDFDLSGYDMTGNVSK